MASQESVTRLASEADHVVCLKSPQRFVSTEQFYAHYDSVDEGTVLAILKAQQAGTSRRSFRRSKIRRPTRYVLKEAFARCFL